MKIQAKWSFRWVRCIFWLIRLLITDISWLHLDFMAWNCNAFDTKPFLRSFIVQDSTKILKRRWHACCKLVILDWIAMHCNVMVSWPCGFLEKYSREYPPSCYYSYCNIVKDRTDLTVQNWNWNFKICP